MRPTRMSTRRWMALVLVVGIGLAARIEFARWEKLRGSYEMLAESYANLESQWQQYAHRTHDEWLSDCRKCDERNKQISLGLREGWGQLFYPPEPGEARRELELIARLRKKYQQAAAFPWLPLEEDPAPGRR
jgi:hypothetical protein